MSIIKKIDVDSLDNILNELDNFLKQELETNDLESIPNHFIEAFLTLAIQLYVTKVEMDENVLPFQPDSITATEVLKVVTRMLDAANVEVFELGMWQAWTASKASFRGA